MHFFFTRIKNQLKMVEQTEYCNNKIENSVKNDTEYLSIVVHLINNCCEFGKISKKKRREHEEEKESFNSFQAID